MSFSENRQLPTDARIERKDWPTLSDSEKRAIDTLMDRIKDDKTEFLGEGRSAEVSILSEESMAQGEGVNPWVIKREKRRTREQELLGIDIEKEASLQDHARRIIESAKAAHPDKNFAIIPRILSRINQENKQILLMDYIPGDTLMERTLKEFLKFYREGDTDDVSDEKLDAMKKDELADMASEPPLVFMLPPRFRDELLDSPHSELDERVFYPLALWMNGVTKGASKILSTEQFEAIRNTLDTLHANSFRHRDLHASNIILMPDGNVSLIDFGLSTDEKAERYYSVETGNALQSRIVKLLPDEDAIEQLAKIARKIK